MPKLTNHRFTVNTADGQRHGFDSEIHVSTDGEFSCTVPDYLVDTLSQVAAQSKAHNLYTGKLKVNHRAYAPSKSDLLSYVRKAHEEFYKAEEIRELIICYDWHAEVSYFIRPDGTLCENGTAPGADYDGAGKWGKGKRRAGGQGINASHPVEQFSVGLFAAVYSRTTFRRPSGDTVTFTRETGRDALPSEMVWGKRLSGFCSLHPVQEPSRMRFMPLTEPAAKFFFDSMLAMAEIGRRFTNFFEDDANVTAAIEGRGPSLLASPKAMRPVDKLDAPGN